MAANRIYQVKLGENKRLVRSGHPATALMHVARDVATVSVATQEEIVDCMSAGIKVEDAKAETAAASNEPHTIG